MKKTITINLANRVFQIEEEAYSMLEQYLRGLRAYFKRTDPDGEITDDIENRISELFAEKKRLGHEVITVEITSEVIHRIGDAQDLIDTEGEETEDGPSVETEIPSSGNEKPHRKFYRDISRRWVGGVLAGLAAYTNIDVWIMRLIFIVLLFTPGTIFFILIYIACAIFVEPAVTVDQRLQMSGKAVSPDAMWKKISEESKELGGRVSDGFSKFRSKYNLGYKTGDERQESAPKKSFWSNLLWGIVGVVIAIILGIGCLYLLAPDFVQAFSYGLEDGFSGRYGGPSDFYFGGFWESLFAGGLGLLTVLIVPLLILLLILFLGLLLAILIVPIGIILKTPLHGLIKAILIVAWFIFLLAML
ncbi:PspC domain-containing protein [Porphyromonas sp.]|uniref:PspC domain-containing protein n=1 Tax=Porphyromonas sp. TaxID=1924944 RepID=UPI0026DBC944|nr:PspC domain-containing protein [Porphyromonas sp.]MDO4770592.1 PspC domain-containing protein [Porphyromonas sp.]